MLTCRAALGRRMCRGGRDCQGVVERCWITLDLEGEVAPPIRQGNSIFYFVELLALFSWDYRSI